MANAVMATALDFSFQSAARYLREEWHGSWETPTRRVLPIGYINGPRAKGKEEMANCRARSTNGCQPESLAPGLDWREGGEDRKKWASGHLLVTGFDPIDPDTFSRLGL